MHGLVAQSARIKALVVRWITLDPFASGLSPLLVLLAADFKRFLFLRLFLSIQLAQSALGLRRVPTRECSTA